MEKTIKLLSRFENDLEMGWDYAIDMLNQGLPYCLNGKYNFLIGRIIDIYYEAYNVYDIESFDYDIDGGLVYEIRSNQINLLLTILNNLKESESKKK